MITMLSDGPTVHDLLFDQELAAAMKAGTLLIDMSSIKPRGPHTCRADARAGPASSGCTVSGGTKGAEAGSLAIMAGGDEQSCQSCVCSQCHGEAC